MATRTTLNISLSVELGAFVENLVRSGRYSSASEVVRSALRLLQDVEQPPLPHAEPSPALADPNLAKSRVLIVEDEPLIAMDLEFRLSELGYFVAGRASNLDSGIAMARELAIDIAVLDVNLASRDSGPVADVLQERGVPVIFASGYTNAGLPQRHQHCLRIAKPYETAALRSALEHALAGKSEGS